MFKFTPLQVLSVVKIAPGRGGAPKLVVAIASPSTTDARLMVLFICFIIILSFSVCFWSWIAIPIATQDVCSCGFGRPRQRSLGEIFRVGLLKRFRGEREDVLRFWGEGLVRLSCPGGRDCGSTSRDAHAFVRRAR